MNYSKEKMRVYMNAYREKQRSIARKALGNKCAKCGAKKVPFHFDHIDPSTKINSIGNMIHFSKKAFNEELKKCQLLCIPCHDKKTRIENVGKNRKPLVHGTVNAYKSYKCRCDECYEWRRNSRGDADKPRREGRRTRYVATE
jgi:hypothetical protein